MNGEKPLVILDMDGVLIDVSESYREVVRRSVLAYLRSVIGAPVPPDGAVTLRDVDAVKKSGGLNNDWDLTYAIIDIVLRRFFDPENKMHADSAKEIAGGGGDDEETLARVRAMSDRFEVEGVIEGVGKMPVREVYAEDRRARFPAGDPPGERHPGGVSFGRSPFLFNRGDVGSGNLVKRIFQELYLGEELFRRIYGLETLFCAAEGLIGRERLIPSTRQLESIASHAALAIATGRPGVEARFPLERYGIGRLFRAVVSEDEIAEAESRLGRPLRKPNPFSIELAIKKSGIADRCDDRRVVFYVGDMPDDMTAALRAGARAIGFVDESGSSDPGERALHEDLLVKKGAEKVFGRYTEMLEYLKG
jgi:HAD superfamily hydrolase (TIGR01548 family)